MWWFLAVVAFCSSPGSPRAGKRRSFFKFYRFYQSKWQIEEEKEGEKKLAQGSVPAAPVTAVSARQCHCGLVNSWMCNRPALVIDGPNSTRVCRLANGSIPDLMVTSTLVCVD